MVNDNVRDLEAELDKILADVSAEALELFRKGIPVDQVVGLAVAIAHAKARGAQRTRQQFAIARPVGSA
mgnify:CR=1 FL=1